jgi:peptide chain release factor 1
LRLAKANFIPAAGSVPISPALLSRARSLALEHKTLTEQTSDVFDTKLAKRIGELQGVAGALKELEDAQHNLAELKNLIEDPTTDGELREYATEDLASTESSLDAISQKLTTSLTPKHPFDDMPALLELRPGVGGGEAALFAGDLFRMYQAYCSRKGLRATVMKYEDTDGMSDASGQAPLQEAILEIESAGAYGILRSEAGVHRVQRVPATESKGRVHTSAVSVLVLPSLPPSGNGEESIGETDLNDPNSDYYVNPTDVRTDVMRARGAGGQHVNTTDSAIRLTHIPTNTVVSMQDSRSQHKNRAAAWNILRSRLAQARRDVREEEMMQLRRGVIGVAKMGRGDKVRTYNWGQQRVTDHRSGMSVHNLDDVMEGGNELDKIIDSVRVWLGEREIENLILEEEAAANKK